MQRRDRPKEAHGGVLIAAKRCFMLSNIYCAQDELISGVIKLDRNKFLTVVSYYRPPNRTDNDYMCSTMSYMERCTPLPSRGNSDHDIVILDTSIQVRRPKPPKREIYLWKRADISGIQDDLSKFAVYFQDRSFDSVNSMRDTFKEQIHQTMGRRVTSKMTLARHTHPWMNGNIRSLIRRKQRAHKQARSTGVKRDRDRYKRLQHKFNIRLGHHTRTLWGMPWATASRIIQRNSGPMWRVLARRLLEFPHWKPVMDLSRVTALVRPTSSMNSLCPFSRKKTPAPSKTKVQALTQTCRS